MTAATVKVKLLNAERLGDIEAVTKRAALAGKTTKAL
jgi:hypothetical protein